MRKKLFAAIFLCFAVFTSEAQTDGLGTWNVFNIKKQINKNWSTFFEAQARSQKMYNDFNYHEYKGGIGYNIAQQFNIVLAAGQYVTYTPTGNFDSVTASEFRLWQQFTLTNNLDRVKIEHRYRTEQRWVSHNYRNRFRYRLNVIVPLNRKKVEKKTFYASVSDEIFLTDKQPYFERNRFFGGAGYVFTDLFTLQAGLLRQFDYRSTGATIGKTYFQLSLLFSLSEDKSNRERHPSTAD